MGTKLSLIICSKNRAVQLKRCLESISPEEMLQVSGELILVNNGSTDNTEEVMYSFKENSPFPVEIVNEPKPGLGRARNAGILASKRDMLVFTDDDCYLAQGYLIKASKVFESGDFHYCGGRILLYDKTDAMITVNYLDRPLIIPAHSAICPGQIKGCNMIFHRKVVDKIGLFDPMFGPGTPFICDDIDYAARASLAGFTGAYIPGLVVYHHHGRKSDGDVENTVKYYAYGMGAFFTKLILMGKVTALIHWIQALRYLRHWIWTSSFTKNPLRLFIKVFIMELCGGIHYLFLRIARIGVK